MVSVLNCFVCEMHRYPTLKLVTIKKMLASIDFIEKIKTEWYKQQHTTSDLLDKIFKFLDSVGGSQVPFGYLQRQI